MLRCWNSSGIFCRVFCVLSTRRWWLNSVSLQLICIIGWVYSKCFFFILCKSVENGDSCTTSGSIGIHKWLQSVIFHGMLLLIHVVYTCLLYTDPHMKTCAPEADVNGRNKWLHPTLSVGCNYLPLPLKPTSCPQILISVFSEKKCVHVLHSATTRRHRVARGIATLSGGIKR